MIGPHNGQELELMLAGKKYFAAFGDILLEDGIIPEEIIPEHAFSPYVESGQILRFRDDVKMPDHEHIMRRVCFTLPGHEWRKDCYLWLVKQLHEGERSFSDADDIMIGRLLGYSTEDIQHFLEHRQTSKIY